MTIPASAIAAAVVLFVLFSAAALYFLIFTAGRIRRLPKAIHSHDQSQAQNDRDEAEQSLMDRARSFSDIPCRIAMTPRVDIFAWPASRTLAEVAVELSDVTYSRILLHGDSLDQITGVLHVRDAFQALLAGQRDIGIDELASQPFFVPGSMTLSRLLSEMRARHVHLAIVADEYGGTDGLITMEDVLEELVGEIRDERDDDEMDAIHRISRNEVVAAGHAELREINHQLNITLPALEFRTINGWLLDRFGRAPESGESFAAHTLRVEILDASESEVLRVRLIRLTPERED